ncbi:hypothetical protein Tco_1511365 [Tanacetum coccineum]
MTSPRRTCRFRRELVSPLPLGASERKTIVAIEVVNLRVIYLLDVRMRESEEFYLRHQYAQEDRAAMRAEIGVLRSERLAYEQEISETRQALTRSEAHNIALEAWIAAIETQLYRMEWQC